MQEVIDPIVEKISFHKKQLFAEFLGKCIQQYYREEEAEKESLREYKSVLFKLDYFFKNFAPFINECGKDKKYESGVEALYLICEELGVEIDKSECFIVFHLKDLGKFKIKESKLYDELKSVWGQYKHYRLEPSDFSAALRNLRNERVIDYRKGNLTVNPTLILRYR